MKHLKRFSVLALAAAVLAVQPVVAQDSLAIKAGKILTISGEPIENGVILISDGRITKVGADLDVPVEARVIDASDKVVMPGIVDAHTSAAMSQANERNTVVPFLSVVDSIDPIRDYFEESRRNGVTTAAVVPGNSTMIGGQGAILKTAGQYVNDMILKRNAGIKLSLAPSSGTSRVSHYAKLRKELQQVRDAIKKEAEEKAEAKKEGDAEGKKEGDESSAAPQQRRPSSPPSRTPQTPASGDKEKAQAALKSLLKGEMPAFIYCATAMDVTQALKLVKDFGIKPVLVLGRECDKAAKIVADADVPVVLDSTLVYWRTDPRTREDEKVALPKVFTEHDAKFLFQVNTSSSRTALGTHYHWYQAATAVRYGMSETDALKALTIDAAKVLGVDKFVGSIEPGKDADLVILTGDPLRVTTWVDRTIVNGKVVYERDKDEKLSRLLEPVEGE